MKEARRIPVDGNAAKQLIDAPLRRTRRPKSRFTAGIDDDVTWAWLPHGPDFDIKPDDVGPSR